MSFLAPLFLLGALGVALPVLFHLIRRSSPRRVPFSTLMFLQPTPPRITRRSRLENLLLLLLRCVVIGLLAVGFARPFVREAFPVQPAAPTARAVVLLLDTSASLRREGMWEAALGRLEARLRALSPGDRVAVVTFDRAPRVVRSFEQWAAAGPDERIGSVMQELRGAGPSWFSTHLGQALTIAAEMLATDREETAGALKQIVAITDLQQGARLEGLQGHEWPRGLEVSFEILEARKPTNAALVGTVEGGEFQVPAAEGARRVRVVNAPDSGREQFRVRWAGGAGGEVQAYVPPGQSRVIEVPAGAGAAAGGPLVLEGDEADFDNRFFAVDASVESVPVLYLGAEAEADPAQLLFYLKRAYQDTRRRRVVVTPQTGGGAVAAERLAPARLAFVGGAVSAEAAASLRAWVSGGGTAVVVMREAGMGSTLGALVESPALVVTEAEGRRYALVEWVDFQHPMFAPFADARFSDFTKIHIWKHRRLAAEGIREARVLMRLDDGAPALLEVPRGAGRFLVWTFGWQPADSQLALSTKFVPLLYGLLEQAAGGSGRATQFVVGQPVPVPSPASGAKREVVSPGGARVELAAEARVFEGADVPGIYTVTGVEPEFRFAVNVDPMESRTAARPVEELERMRVPLRVEGEPVSVEVQAATRARLEQAELEARQKLWRWLIVGALVVLLGETWLAGRLSRGRPAAGEVAT